MNKSSIIIVVISVVVTVSIAVIGLLLLIPQMVPVSESTEEYEGIKKSEYTYEPTKNIQEEPEVQQYLVTTENISEGKSSKNYVAGKTNPFASSETTSTEGTSTTGTNTNTSGTSTSSGTTTNTTTPISASDK